MRLLCSVVVLLVFVSAMGAAVAEPQPVVCVATVEGIINVVTKEYLLEAIERTDQLGAVCLIIELDTPGGELESTKSIVQAIFAARRPVVVYVMPKGARAASAGTFLLMAAHVAAMSPATRTGAAHPVLMPFGFPGRRDDEQDEEQQDQRTTMMDKILNDTVAFARGIARERGRNVEWVEQAVRESVSIGEDEAIELNVIDLIADDLKDLLVKLDGRRVQVGDSEVTLQASGALVERLPMGWRRQILYVISNPNVLFILFLFGIYGIIYELMRPGMIFPGVVGVICLVLSFFAMQVLPVSWAGAVLLVLGIGLLITEIYVTSYGLLTVGGLGCLFLGGVMLVRPVEPHYAQFLTVSWKVVLVVIATTAAIFALSLAAGLLAQRRKVSTGKEGLVGEAGIAQTDLNPRGKVFLHGEIWSATADQPIEKGSAIRVVRVEGMELFVTRSS